MHPYPASNPSRRSIDSQRAILTAAAELVIQEGYSRASIEAIVAKAGVGKQTIYRWWPNKISLFIEVYGTHATGDFESIDYGNFRDDLKSFIEQILIQLSDPVASAVFLGMIAEANSSDGARAVFQNFIKNRFKINSRIIERAISRSELPESTDVDAISIFVGGAFSWALISGIRKIDDQFAELVFEHISRSFPSV